MKPGLRSTELARTASAQQREAAERETDAGEQAVVQDDRELAMVRQEGRPCLGGTALQFVPNAFYHVVSVGGFPAPAAWCWKQRPTWKSWETRYVVLDGTALQVFATEGDFSASATDVAAARGSSVPDLTGYVVAKAPRGKHGPSLQLQHSQYEYGQALFQFDSEVTRDAMYTACKNVAAGRAWNSPLFEESESEPAAEVASVAAVAAAAAARPSGWDLLKQKAVYNVSLEFNKMLSLPGVTGLFQDEDRPWWTPLHLGPSDSGPTLMLVSAGESLEAVRPADHLLWLRWSGRVPLVFLSFIF